MKEYYRVEADINLDAIYNNIKRTKEFIQKGTKLMVVIKADGYGHGAVPIARVIDHMVDAYGVAIPEEGIELRRSGVKKPILVLGFTPQPLFSQLVTYDLIPTIFQYEMAKEFQEEAILQNKSVAIHIKVDTGMNRIGFPDNEHSIEEIKRISELDGLQIEGCFTHMAKADETDKTFALEQQERFRRFIEQIEEAGVSIPIKHMANSATIMELPEYQYDMVRCGISTYGLYPSEEVDKSHIQLEPAMAIKSHVAFVKEVGPGVSVSYGGTYVTEKTTRIATIPVGYGDGYPRALSSRGRVLIHGKSAPILGRVCMDQFMVDVTHIEHVKPGDQVILLGKGHKDSITVEELARLGNSFHYELVCNIGKRVPRVYYFRGEKVGTLDYYNCMETTYQLPLL